MLVRCADPMNARHIILVIFDTLRRDAVGSSRSPLLDDRMAPNIAPADIDQLAASLQHRTSRNRLFLT